MWQSGEAYENYMGRWSRRVAKEFIHWLSPPARWNWLELGCGTGALTQAISQYTTPASVVACDPSAELVSYASSTLAGTDVTFLVTGVDDLPLREDGFDAVVSGLVLNFLPDPAKAVRSMCSRLRPQGLLAAYVWDYADGMPFLQIFWDEAIKLDTRATSLNQRELFPLCQPKVLEQLLIKAGLEKVVTHGLEISMSFDDFASYWTPFLGGTGPAPAYLSSLDPAAREELRTRLNDRVAPSGNEPFVLTARAWAVLGYLGI